MNDPSALKRRYQQFADAECKGYSDVYYRLALAVAGDDEVVGFIAGMPVTQPNLFFASVQYLTGPDRMPVTGAELRALVKSRGGEIAQVMKSHRTQTNEVGRCAVLLPALPSGPLALIEIGASAGLCLLLDRFCYRYPSSTVGLASSPVRLSCTLTGLAPVPAMLPRIAWRCGLDIHPLDVRDEDAVQWLRACVWSDQPERRRRLDGAVDLARVDPPPVRVGDLVDDLPTLLAEAPQDVQLVVFHSAVFGYIQPERRQAFGEVLRAASKRREVVWISNEGPGLVPGIPAPTPARPERFLLGRTTFKKGRRRDELLALAHPHGGEATWL